MGVDTSEHRSLDTSNMFNYAFANYKLNNIINRNDEIAEVSVKRGLKEKVVLYAKEDVNDLIKQNEVKEYSYKIDKRTITAPINEGDVVGRLEVYDNNGNNIGIVDLIVKENIKKHNFATLFLSNLKNIINGYL